MTETNNLKLDQIGKKYTSIKASIIVVIISFCLSIIDMGLITDCDYSSMSSFAKAVVVFDIEGLCSLALLIGIIVSSIYIAKKKIGPSILVVNIILLLIWVFTAVCSFFSILSILGPWTTGAPSEAYIIDVSQYHFNFIYYEHYRASLDSITLITYVDYDHYLPYILFVGNLIVTAIVIPLYVKEYVKHKSENKTE